MVADSEKPFTKAEKFVCEMIWGTVPAPIHTAWARETSIFKEAMERFKTDVEWKRLLSFEKEKTK